MPIIDFTNVEKVYRGSVEMKKVYEGSTVVWEKPVPVDPKTLPLYIELVNPSDTVPLQIMANGTTNKTLAYSYDNQNWTGYTATNNPYTIQLNSSNPRVYFRATANGQWNTSGSIYWYFKKYATASDVPLRVGGNIYSLENTGTSYQTVISPRGNYSFYRLFQNFTCLTDASKLFLGESGSILTSNCYQNMFYGCNSLTQAPALPATTLAAYCYSYMFYNCTSLTSAPMLPSTSAAQYCYNSMFQGCTSLVSLPDDMIKITSGNQYWADSMFYGCTSLENLDHITIRSTGSHGCEEMFQGCTRLKRSPKITAGSLSEFCFAYMFSGCYVLNYIYCTSPSSQMGVSGPYNQWVSNVAPTGTFVRRSTVNWSRGASGVPNNWTIQNA